MVGIDRVAVLLGGQMEGLAQGHRDEGVDRRAGGKDAFVHREHDHTVEIQSACLQHTHQLQAAQGFAREGHRETARELAHDMEEGLHVKRPVHPGDESRKAFHHVGIGAQELAVEDGELLFVLVLNHTVGQKAENLLHIFYGILQVLRRTEYQFQPRVGIQHPRRHDIAVLPVDFVGQFQGFLPRYAEGVMMGEQRDDALVEKGRLSPADAAGLLQAGQMVHECRDGCALQAVAHRDVVGRDVCRHGIHHGQHQILGRQHHGRAECLLRRTDLPFLQLSGGHLGLPHTRRHHIDIEFLFGIGHQASLAFLRCYGIWEILQVPAGEECALRGHFTLTQARVVIVPAELGHSLFAEPLHQGAFGLGDGGQTHEDNLPGMEQLVRVGTVPDTVFRLAVFLYHLPFQHAFIGQSLLAQFVTEGFI